jgi:hypothetical protein
VEEERVRVVVHLAPAAAAGTEDLTALQERLEEVEEVEAEVVVLIREMEEVAVPEEEVVVALIILEVPVDTWEVAGEPYTITISGFQITMEALEGEAEAVRADRHF